MFVYIYTIIAHKHILFYWTAFPFIQFKITIFLFFTELLSSWESLLHWSENESVAKKLQDEMAALVGKLNKIGTSNATLDTESTIQLAIEDAKVRAMQHLVHTTGL